jgi:uncharacterized protein (DUF1800 family)
MQSTTDEEIALGQSSRIDNQHKVEEGTGPAGGAPALSAALAAAALLAACGGGDDPPEALVQGRAEVAQPQLLGGTGSSASRSAATRMPTADEFMDWAERQFPQFFSPHASTLRADALSYRFYAGTGLYLGVLNGEVLALGPATGGKVAALGRVADFADAVLAGSGGSGSVASDEAAARFLHQAAFGASDADIAAVRSQGYAGWLDAQLAMPMGQSKWDWLVAQGYAVANDRAFFFNNSLAQYAVWHDLFSATDMVRQRWALALSEVFVISVASIGGSLNWPGFAGAHYWDTLARLGLGNFRALLEAVTLHPAMGAFLNTRGNQKEDPATGRVPDENYAREVMQLFTIGLHELNPDGTPRLGANGQPIETYGPADVTNLARVFTGYDIDASGLAPLQNPVPPGGTLLRPEYLQRPMRFDASRHSTLEKRFLGTSIPGGTPGPEALRMALDVLFNHRNVGPFFARQMIQRLVTSNPEPAYVARVAAVFDNNGAGVRGDLKAVLRAILLDDAARGPAGLNSRSFGKLREPMLRVVNWGRAFKARSLANTWKYEVGNWDPESDLQQIPLNAPSVFNFYRPGYVPPSTEMAAIGATVPEFQLVSESSVSGYINFLQGILYSGLWIGNPTEIGFPRDGQGVTYVPDIVPDYSAEFALVGDTAALVRRLNLLLAAGQLSQATQDFIANALRIDRISASADEGFKRIHVARAILFVMSSAEYLVKK